MRNKLLSLLLCLTVFLTVGTTAVKAGHSYTVAEAESLRDGIVGYKAGGGAQDFIDNGLCADAGISAEFYVIALSQSGSYDFSAYENALLRYLGENEIYSATSREKYALALMAAGSQDRYIAQVADEAIGGQGLMSLVFGLHLLNNGCPSRLYSAEGLVNTILGYQLGDGGWAVIGDRGDVDVTAMTLQALAPYYHLYSDVESAVDRALTLLSDAQQNDGGFFGMGVENCESAAQVLCALSDLGIDANADSRFIKNGSSVLDALVSYRNADGSFAHTGSGYNESATVEAFYALTAYIRFCRGQGPLYVLDHRRPIVPLNEDTPDHRTDDKQEQRQAADNDDGGNQDSGGDHQEQSRSGQNIIYINGQAYREATDSKGRKETVAVSATQSATVPPEKPTVRDAGKGAGLFQPTATASQKASVDEAAPTAKESYKPYAIGAVLAAALAAAGVLFLLKKRNKKHYIAVGILAAVGILFILLTNFQSVESYHTVEEKADTVGRVTISIRCDTLKDEKKPSYIPDDCIILDTTTFAIEGKDTVYHILMEASQRCSIQVDNRGAAGSAYIAGIGYLYEFDYGDLSGWMYKVNGEFPDVGCQSYLLHDGDKIEWLYTKNIGKDL